MKKRWFAILNTVLVSLAAVAALMTWVATAPPAAAKSVRAAPLEASSPTVTDITPDAASNDLDVSAVITGTGFAAELAGPVVLTSPTALLGNTPLKGVTWVNDTTLDAIIPWGLKAGVYTLTVINPDGGMASLPNAITLTEGVNAWTTGGPYGGQIFYLNVNPITPTTLYAAVLNAGVFATNDAAGHWQESLIDNYPLRQAMDPIDPRGLYVGGHLGCYRTLDGSHTWVDIAPQPGVNGLFCTPAPHPTQPGVVYVGVGANPWPPQPGQEGNIYRSDNYGSTWVTKSVGLTDTQVTALVFYPDVPAHMIAGTRSGNIFVTVNGGEAWTWAAQVGTHVERLYVDPFGAHQVWIVSQMPFWPQNPPFLYRSLDPGLTQWEPVALPDGGPMVSSLTFHPAISGTVWAGANGGYQSTDGGATWAPLAGSPPGGVSVFAVDISQIPQRLYAGNRQGLFESQDDGATWTEVDNGVAGVVPDALAVTPAQPDEVYASTQVLGLLKSTNGGHSWQALGTQRNGFPWQGSSMAVDPVTSTRVYLGEQCHDGPCMRISANGGQDWHPIAFSVPVTWSGWSGEVFAVAPNPRIPGRVLAGATFYPPNFDWNNPSRPEGGFYISNDAGEHFTYRPTTPISGVVQFAYDAVDPNLVYAATEGTGLWRSTDGGLNWELATPISANGYIWSVVTDPWLPNTVWIAKWQSSQMVPEPSNLFSSTDAGRTWTPVPWSGAHDRGIRTMLFAPTFPSSLYIGTEGGGLYRTRDRGQNWELLPGMPDNGTFYALAAGSDAKRVAVYIGTAGGASSTAAAAMASRPAGSTSAQASGTTVGAGVYRLLTAQSIQRVYLPLLSRAKAY